MKGIAQGKISIIILPMNLTMRSLFLRKKGGVLGILSSGEKLRIIVKSNGFGIFDGNRTGILAYEINYNNMNYINPVFKLKKDSVFKANLMNNINEDTIIH